MNIYHKAVDIMIHTPKGVNEKFKSGNVDW